MPTDTNLDRAIYSLLSQLFGNVLGVPIGAGNVFWVDGINGNNGNSGTRPDEPWLTITYALTQCVNEHNDYIMVLDAWQEPAAVDINVTRVHIIGLANYLRKNSNNPLVCLNAVADHAIFLVSALSNNSEIAGFAMGGGATHAAIENAAGTPMNLHIHDCVFGHSFAGNTPQDGIRVEINATNIRIEHCVFIGTECPCGLLTRDGIRFQGGGDPLQGNIENNQFKGLPGVGLHMVNVAAGTGGFTIKDNVFVSGADVPGAAITLGANLARCLVAGNQAAFGEAKVALANPYLDGAAPNANAWMANFDHETLSGPA